MRDATTYWFTSQLRPLPQKMNLRVQKARNLLSQRQLQPMAIWPHAAQHTKKYGAWPFDPSIAHTKNIYKTASTLHIQLGGKRTVFFGIHSINKDSLWMSIRWCYIIDRKLTRPDIALFVGIKIRQKFFSKTLVLSINRLFPVFY